MPMGDMGGLTATMTATDALPTWIVEVTRHRDPSKDAVDLAVDHAASQPASILLVHVITEVPCGRNKSVAASEADSRSAAEHAKKLADILLRPLLALAAASNAPCSAVVELNDSRDKGIAIAARRADAQRLYMGVKKKLLGWSSSATVAQCQASLPSTCRLFITQGTSRVQQLQAAGKPTSTQPIPPPFFTLPPSASAPSSAGPLPPIPSASPPAAPAISKGPAPAVAPGAVASMEAGNVAVGDSVARAAFPVMRVPASRIAVSGPVVMQQQQPPLSPHSANTSARHPIGHSLSSVSLPPHGSDASLASPSALSSVSSARFFPSAQQQVGAGREAQGNAEANSRGGGSGAHARGQRSASCGGVVDGDSALLAQQLQELNAVTQGEEGASREVLERQLQQVMALQHRIQQQLKGSPHASSDAGASLRSASPASLGSAHGTAISMRISVGEDGYPVSPGSLSQRQATSPLGQSFIYPRSPSAAAVGSGGMSAEGWNSASHLPQFPRVLSNPDQATTALPIAAAADGQGGGGTRSSHSSCNSSPAVSFEARLLPPRCPPADAHSASSPTSHTAAAGLQRSPSGGRRSAGSLGSMGRVWSHETLVALREVAEEEEGRADAEGEGEGEEGEEGHGRSLADELAALAAEDAGEEGAQSNESWKGKAVSSNRGGTGSSSGGNLAEGSQGGRSGSLPPLNGRTPDSTSPGLSGPLASGLPPSGSTPACIGMHRSPSATSGPYSSAASSATDAFLPLDSFESSEASQTLPSQQRPPSRFQHLTAMSAHPSHLHPQSQGPLLAPFSQAALPAHSQGASYGRAAYSSGQLTPGMFGGAGGEGYDCRQFTAQQLDRATGSYTQQNLLGRGSFGMVFKGEMLGCKVAVKRLEGQGWQGPDEFRVEVEVLSKMRHPHIVLLMGCCVEEMALVYEFLPGGTLQDKLGPPKGSVAVPLSWADRLRIASEVASALVYLHQNEPPIVHRDLKPDNILLDGHMASKIGDVGLARLLEGGGETTMKVRGTAGYIDPEEVETCEISVLSDVYALGLILLQLLTGQRSVKAVHRMLGECAKAGKGKGKAADVGPGGASRAAVAVVMRYLDTAGGEWRVDLVEEVVGMALRCAERRRAKRPDLVGEIHPVLMRVAGEADKEVKQRKKQMDSQLLCPISKEVMRDPVVAGDGFTYEREHIERWMAGCQLSPATGQPLPHSALTPNNVLKNLIASHRQR